MGELGGAGVDHEVGGFGQLVQLQRQRTQRLQAAPFLGDHCLLCFHRRTLLHLDALAAAYPLHCLGHWYGCSLRCLFWFGGRLLDRLRHVLGSAFVSILGFRLLLGTGCFLGDIFVLLIPRRRVPVRKSLLRFDPLDLFVHNYGCLLGCGSFWLGRVDDGVGRCVLGLKKCYFVSKLVQVGLHAADGIVFTCNLRLQLLVQQNYFVFFLY